MYISIVTAVSITVRAIGDHMGSRTEGRPQLRSDSIRIELQNFADGRSSITNLLYRRPSVRGRMVACFY